MVLGDSVLLKADGTFELVGPEGEKFSEGDLTELVKGGFFIVHTSNKEKCFVIKHSTEDDYYNINANYLFRRYVKDIIILRGRVLLCNCELIEEAVRDNFTKETSAREDMEAAE